MALTIRKERFGDTAKIDQVITTAFLDASHTDHTEQFIVQALRDTGALSVSLVAEDSDRIVGYVALSPVRISDGTRDWFGLGPIAVVPEQQGNGIGSQLMGCAFTELKKIRAAGCVVLGDPVYYKRFGFSTVEGLVLPGVPPEFFQARLLRGPCPQGEVSYHESFLAQG